MPRLVCHAGLRFDDLRFWGFEELWRFWRLLLSSRTRWARMGSGRFPFGEGRHSVSWRSSGEEFRIEGSLRERLRHPC